MENYKFLKSNLFGTNNMLVKKLFIKNFKSFGSNGTNVYFNNGANTIVGENNVGKSNILRSISFIKTILTQEYKYTSDDWYQGNTELAINIDLSLELSDKDLQEILYVLKLPRDSYNDFKSSFGNILEVKISKEKIGEPTFIFFKIGELTFFRESASIYPINPRAGYNHADWESITNRYETGKTNLRQMIGESLRNENYRLVFRIDINKIIGQLLENKIIVFPEFRRRPTKTTKEVFESPEGEYVSSLLFDIKNARGEPKRKFELIKKTFSELYANLEIDVMKGPEITIKKVETGYEVPLDFIGAGIAEMVIFLTHLVAAKDNIFFIDEPELHLHPHSQRLLVDILHKSSSSNQIIVVTHSTFFVNLTNIENIIRVNDSEYGSKIVQPTKNLLIDKEKEHLKRLLKSEHKEFLFSRGVVLVEGDTEYGALPVFAQKLNKNFNNKAISIVPVGGKHFIIFLKLLKTFQLPYVIMCDLDAVKTINRSIDYDGSKIKTSQLFAELHDLDELDSTELDLIKEAEKEIIKDQTYTGHSPEIYSEDFINRINDLLIRHNCFVIKKDFEDVLIKSDCKEEFITAQKVYPKSKILQGIHTAENSTSVPQEIASVIDRIYELV